MKSFSFLKENQILIGVLNPFTNKAKIENLIKKKINNFSLELLPRITRCSIYGYFIITSKFSWIQSCNRVFAHFEKAIPMMMTAAGTVPAAKVLIVGAGVAGLQAR